MSVGETRNAMIDPSQETLAYGHALNCLKDARHQAKVDQLLVEDEDRIALHEAYSQTTGIWVVRSLTLYNHRATALRRVPGMDQERIEDRLQTYSARATFPYVHYFPKADAFPLNRWQANQIFLADITNNYPEKNRSQS